MITLYTIDYLAYMLITIIYIMAGYAFVVFILETVVFWHCGDG